MMSFEKLKRPTTIKEMHQCSWKWITKESWLKGMSFQLKPTDVVVSPYPKCGTTWVQQIVHGLRTRGSMAFDEIIEVSPWLEIAFDVGINLDKPQPALPRLFKSHMFWEQIPKGGKYIYVIRDPKDTLVSKYHFEEGWWFEKGSISIEEYAKDSFIPDNAYWLHLLSWWQQLHNPNVLILCFEDLKKDLSKYIPLIAHFINCELDQELQDIVLRQSSFEFMKKHEHKFDEHITRGKREKVMGLPSNADVSKIRKGDVGDAYLELPDSVHELLDKIWNQVVRQKTQFKTFQEMRTALSEVNYSSYPLGQSQPYPQRQGKGELGDPPMRTPKNMRFPVIE
ncbi:MAG: sulfotransferase [SAR324 cluster bacterium]|uniref:Sulfotransferase n=1 Tax=SAR324 cluster bacterium TaxID=2024889 RepID=A0A2A4T1P8_9DELT|nr:MAG: sulfotransferase [SAR324 cluster bacterium]